MPSTRHQANSQVNGEEWSGENPYESSVHFGKETYSLRNPNGTQWNIHGLGGLTVRGLFSYSNLNFKSDIETDSYGAAYRPGFVDIDFGHIELWTDFTEENVERAFGHLLDVPVRYSVDVHQSILAQRDLISIRVEKDMDGAFDACIRPLLLDSLRDLHLARLLGNPHAEALAICELGDPKTARVRVHPAAQDFSAGLAPRQGPKRPNFPLFVPRSLADGGNIVFAIGECARSGVFNAEWLLNAEEYNGRTDLRAQLGKFGMYLQASGTCLGWVTTPVGVTVFRYFIMDGTSSLGLQHRTFNWQGSGMKPIQAIFAVVLMSLREPDRRIVARSQLKSFGEWSPL